MVENMGTASPAVERAPATLIFVPGLGHDTSNSADVIATSIATVAARYGDPVIASKDKLPAATKGLKAVATLMRGDDRVVDVTELAYREALEGLAKGNDDKEGVAPSLFVQSLYTVFGVTRWIKAWRRPNKSRLAKFQLFLGLAAMLVLFTALLIALVGVVTTVVIQLGWDQNLPAWATDSAPWLALTGGLVSAGMLAKWRRGILRGAQRTQQLLRYFNDTGARESITNPVLDAVDKLRESGYTGQIHILAYSFGSVVTLGAFTRFDSTRAGMPDGVREAASIVTVGCPFDFVSLYFPKHFETETAWRPELPWHNVFIPADVLGSNMLIPLPGHRPDDASDANTTVMGWPVTNHVYHPEDKLGVWSVLFQWAGLTRHNGYWDRNAGCWEPLLQHWGFPTDDARPDPVTPGLHDTAHPGDTAPLVGARHSGDTPTGAETATPATPGGAHRAPVPEAPAP